MSGFNAYLRHFEEEVLPHMMESGVVVVILTDGLDSKICLEVGAAVLLDKQLLVLTTSLTLVPERLRRVSDKIVVLEAGNWKSEESYAKIQEAIKEIVGK